MNRHDLQYLQQIKGYPCVTITLPTHRTSPDNQQDPIRVRNLVKQAIDGLVGYSTRDAAPLLARLGNLVGSIDYRSALDGLALFVNADIARAIYLPFTLKERVVIADSFHTRDLVFALNRTPRYWALVLSEKPTRLYEGARDELIEISEGGFPMAHTGPGAEQPLPGGFGVRKSAYRDERRRQFYRQVDQALGSFLADDPLPLVVVGVNRFLAFFNQVTKHKEAILVTLTGSHDKTPSHDLGQLVWPAVRAGLAEQRNRMLSELEKAVGQRTTASAVGEVGRLAREGRGRLLLVEEGYHFPVSTNEMSVRRIPTDAGESGAVEDAVDGIIETVLNKQGQVVFVDNGQLEVHQHIALILRY